MSDAALARCVGDRAAFLADRFTVGPYLHHGAGYTDLLSLADVDAELAGGGLRSPAVRLVDGGEPVDPASWTRRARTGGRRIDDLVDPDRALACFDAGATIVLQSLQRWWPPLARFCRDLEAVLGHPMQANAYLTPPGATGLAPHHDTHDVFVLQVHGSKRWTVRAPLVDAPLPRHRSTPEAAARQPVVLEAELQPGDCLYLPRGFVHAAAAQEAISLHLTIGVLATTAHDVLRDLVDRAADDVRFRRTLDPAGGAHAVKAVVADLVAWLEGVDVDAVAAGLAARAAGRRRPRADGRLLSLAGIDRVGDATVVVAPPDLAAVPTVDGDRAVLAIGERTVAFPVDVVPAVELLLDGSSHRVGDLSRMLDEPSRLVLVRRLVREGLLRVVDGA